MSTLALRQQVYSGLNLADVVDGFLRPQGEVAIESTFQSDLQIPATLSYERDVSKARLEAALRSFIDLPHDWDGYGGESAGYKTYEDAVTFIGRLPLNAKTPRAMLAGNGEISVCWEDGDKYLEASFSGDGTFHYFFDAPGPQGAGDDIEISRTLPDSFKTIIQKHFV